jgi:hypothetical protein
MAASLQQFVRSVHRRMVLARVLECAGAGVAIASVIALPLAIALLWRGRPAFDLAVTAVATGAVTGTLLGIVRRPSELLAAIEADRQLNLNDLLSTALALRGRSISDPFMRAMLSRAADHCAAISPSAVIARRWRAHRWGGVGALAGILLAMGALSLTPTIAASDASRSSASSARVAEQLAPAAPVDATPEHRGSVASESPRIRPPIRSGQDEPGAFATSDDHANSAAPTNDDTQHESPAGENGAGSASRTQEGARSPIPDSPGAAAQKPDATGDFAGGTSEADSSHQQSPARPQGGAADRGRSQRLTQPELFTRRDRAAAINAVRAGRVPAARRDLVRAYFDPLDPAQP